MSDKVKAAVDSDDDKVDVTEYTSRGKKVNNSKSAWTSEGPKNMRQEVQVAEIEATFYRKILDVIIARLDPNMEMEELDRIVLPPIAPSDIRKKLRKYRVEAKNIIEFIENNMKKDDEDDRKDNEDEKAEATFVSALLEKLGTAVKEETIPSRFRLPRVPVVDAERKDRLKEYRKDSGLIVDCLRLLKVYRIDGQSQTDFPEEDPEWRIKQTRVTEYIRTGSPSQEAPMAEKKATKSDQRTRQTQTDFDEQGLSKASVGKPMAQSMLLHPPSYHTVLADYRIAPNGVAVARQNQNNDFSKTVRGDGGHDFERYQQSQQGEQFQENYQDTASSDHHHHHYHHQQQTQSYSGGPHDNGSGSFNAHGRSMSAKEAEAGIKPHDNQPGPFNTPGTSMSAKEVEAGIKPWNPDRDQRGQDPFSGHGSGSSKATDPRSSGDEHYASGLYIGNYDGGEFPRRREKQSKESYIELLEEHIFKLSCRISELETQLHDSQRNLVVTTHTTDAVMSKVSKNVMEGIHSLTRGLTDLSDDARPIKLAEQFSSIYDQQWVDIYSFETKQMGKSERCAIADILEILQCINQTCIRLSAEQLENWKDQVKSRRKTDLPEFLRDTGTLKDEALHNCLKQNQIEMAEKVLDSVRKEVLGNEAMASFYGPEIASCEEFMFVCVDVCWLMAVKSLPMVLDFSCKKGSKFNKNVFRTYTKSGKKYDYVVWPAIYIYEMGDLLNKGVAQPL